MMERFTDRARRVMVLAMEEARMLNHNYIGSEHILLGLLHDGEGVAAKALGSIGISLAAARREVEHFLGQGQQVPSGHIPFTPRAKKVLELSSREARKLAHKHVSTGHLLLGLIREGEDVAVQTLVKLGADLPTFSQQLYQQLSTHGDQEGTSAAEQGLVDEELELPDDDLAEHGAFAFSDQGQEIRALLRDVVQRLERIERHLTERDDTR